VPVNDLSRAIRLQRREIDDAVARVLDSGWVVLGPAVSAFESELASYVGAQHAASVANGTDALVLALAALGVGAGDRVATVANAGGYSTTAIRLLGAVPVYVDVDPATALMTPGTLAPALELGLKVAVVTHLFGAMADAAALAELCHAHDVRLLEDCAQAIGAEREGRRAGSVGDAAAFSFYPTKNLGALGDGGAVCTSDADLDATVRSLRQYGWSSKYHISRTGGRNSRLDEVQAAILRRRLPLLDDDNARRRAVHARYAAAVGAERCFGTDDGSFVAHLAVLRVDDREAARAALADAGIGTDVHYPVPDHLQKVDADLEVAGTLAVTEELAREILTVPCFPELSDDEVDRVCEVLATW
jgi:dTDP-3-amino-2,3,6-trideoxy-4-keto-D-glucose/dTDP-3-amino-3,4,6-trideoxy-alpha-D-glucose/dTDP-2,6-dideoxy-D-kanosamine transaminase